MLLKIKEALQLVLMLAAIVSLVETTLALRSLASLAERTHVYIDVGRTPPSGGDWIR
jgi:hypothetical protein